VIKDALVVDLLRPSLDLGGQFLEMAAEFRSVGESRYDSLVAVVAGTTIGMMLADVPAVWVGEALARRINMKVMRGVAAGLFVLLGILALLA